MKRAVLCLVAVLFAASVAKANSVLSGALTVDNQFVAYLSTSPTVQGTQIASGNNWMSAVAIAPTQLTWGTTYYLQIDAQNWQRDPQTGQPYTPETNPGALLGSFTLAGGQHLFSNGSANLLTNTANWTYSYAGFGTAAMVPIGEGLNGTNIWGSVLGGSFAGISSSAQWIWDPTVPETNGSWTYYSYSATDLFFETEITPAPGVTPEPGSLFLLGSGLTALAGFIARRRRSA